MFEETVQIIWSGSSGEILEVNVTFMLFPILSPFPNGKQVVTEC